MTLLLTVIVVALVFEFINGFHDTANSVAAVVGTRVLTPSQAIVLGGGHESVRRAGGHRRRRPRSARGWWTRTASPAMTLICAPARERCSGTCSPGGWACLPAPATR